MCGYIALVPVAGMAAALPAAPLTGPAGIHRSTLDAPRWLSSLTRDLDGNQLEGTLPDAWSAMSALEDL